MVVPITLVTGFLGAGKTTLLSHVLRDPQGLRLAVLVNDLGAVNIDADLLRDSTEDVVPLENGCICCSLAGGLLASVTKVLRRPDPPDRILIEASGVADPFEIIETLADPELRAHAPLDGVVAVVDAAQMADPDPDVLPLARRQVQSAGLIVLNKTDLTAGGEAAYRWVKGISAAVPVVRTEQAAIPLPQLFGIGLRDVVSADRRMTEAFESTTIRSGDPLSLPRLHALLADPPAGVFRIKGTLNLAEKPLNRCLLQVSGQQASITVGQPWDGAQPETRLVFIGLAGRLDQGRILQRLGLNESPASEASDRLAAGT